MANKLPPVKNTEYTFGIVLFAQADDQIKTTPTIAAGDFQVSTDGGAFGNLSTLPSESPASSGRVLVTLSTSEMNGDEVMVRWIDAADDEWHSGAVTIFTAGQTFDTIDANVDSVLDDTGTTIPAQISGLNNISAADVNAQVLDVLNVDTFAELTGVPADDATLTQMVRWLYLLARNKVEQTATTQTIYADDGSTSVATSAVSDNGTTFTRAEYS